MGDRVRVGESTLQSIIDGAIKGDFSDNDSGAKTTSQITMGLIPILGQMADARDTIAASRSVVRGESGSLSNFGFALAGWVPLAGDFIKSARKIGLRETFNAIGSSLSSISDTWKYIRGSTDDMMGTVQGWFYKPATEMKATTLNRTTHGVTNRFGDVQINARLSDEAAQSTLDHEHVHRFFSPTFLPAQKLRADIGLLGYSESHLLRRIEEGLAESWARLRAEGLTGLSRGWSFPYRNDYGIDPARVVIERNVLIGVGGTAVASGLEIGDRYGDAEVRGSTNAEAIQPPK
jgi:hypothetical protein